MKDNQHPDIPKTILCHCGEVANIYTTRTYVNQLGYKVYRSFYRCTNCLSRVNSSIARKPPKVIYISETMKSEIVNDDHYDVWFIVRSRPRLTNRITLGPVPDNWFNVWEFHEIIKY